MPQHRKKHEPAGHCRGTCLNDPEVLRLASNGYEVFRTQTARRILEECGEKVFFNLCPKCAALARTPTAKQCRFCGWDWHERV